MRVAACWKLVDIRSDVDPLSGEPGAPTWGVSEADRAALEWALRVAERWSGEAIVVTAGPAAADVWLREAVAAGAATARRVDLDGEWPSATVAAALATQLRDVDVVVCGDWSLDRGSGAVPAFLAAELGAAQALGLVTLEATGPGQIDALRRLDGGRRERLRVTAPAVLSVEAGSARLRRASLPAVLAAAEASVPAATPAPPAATAASASTLRARAPYRPRPRVLAAPDPHLPARERVLALSGALTPRTPPERLALDPAAAAGVILDRLAAWGYR